MAKQVKVNKVEILDVGTCARWYEILKKHFEKDLIFFRDALDVSTEEKIRLLFASIAFYELSRQKDFDLAVARAKTARGLGDWYVYKKNARSPERKIEKDLLM